MKWGTVTLIIFIIALNLLQANASSIGHWPGMIPKAPIRPVAVDLVENGELLTPDELMLRKERGEDISVINPEFSDLWSTALDSQIIAAFENVQTNEELKFQNTVASRPGNFRFVVSKNSAQGKINLNVMMNKNIHNLLLRKKLLESIGYKIPQMQYLSKVTISFENKFDMETFLLSLSQETFGAKERWLLSMDEINNKIVLQDIIVMASDTPVYNLALGAMPSSVIQNRRVLNSLLIAYTLGTSTESINLLNWESGRIISDAVKLDYEDAEEFTPSWEDARWMTRQLAKLTRTQFELVVKSAHFPREVELLLIEKMISRRNSLIRLFELNISAMPFNSEISSGEYLKKGKLLKENWPDHAERFSYGDPKTPLSASEMLHFFKGKAISTGIDNLLNAFNQYVIPRTDVAAKVAEHQIKVFDQNFQEFLRTGVSTPIPFGVYAIPTFGGQLIASRDVIAGTYMGADNLVQLADSFGVAVDLGVHIGIDGITAPIIVSGGAKASLMRRYTHLRPISSIKEALKTPWKNILVPLLKRNKGKILDDILASQLRPDGREEELQKKITEVVAHFKKELPIGESIMITDSVGGILQIGAGYGLTEYIQAQLQFFSRQQVLSRLHILRRSEDVIQIYQDLGAMAGVGASFGLNAIVPILRISVELQKGKARTRFFQLNIKGELKENPDLIKNLLALRTVLIHNDLEMVKAIQNPYTIEHNFNVQQSNFNFLFWRLSGRTLGDVIAVTHPAGAQKYFIKHSRGKRSGRDYQALVTEVVNGMLSFYTNAPIGLMNEGNGNPGDSFMGSAKTTEVNFEAEMDRADARNAKFSKPYLNISTRWKGWSISAKKAKKILDKINQQFTRPLVSPMALGTTTKLQLYTINLEMNFYSRAVEAAIAADKKRLQAAYHRYAEFEDLTYISYMPGDGLSHGGFRERYTRAEQISSAISRVARYQKKFTQNLAKGRVDKAAKYGAKLFSYIQENLQFAGVAEICGGTEHLYVTAQLRGFRKGDENGDMPYVSDSLGNFGDAHLTGPLASMKNSIGLTDAEFYAYWMMGVF